MKKTLKEFWRQWKSREFIEVTDGHLRYTKEARRVQWILAWIIAVPVSFLLVVVLRYILYL